MDLYAQYIAERENAKLIEKPWGFATYKYQDIMVYIQDIYIIPEERGKGRVDELESEILYLAKQNDCTHALGSVALNVNGVYGSMKMLKKRGYRYFNQDMKSGMLYFIKEIK